MTNAVVLAKVNEFKYYQKDKKQWKTIQTQNGITALLVKAMKKAQLALGS